MFYYFLFFLPLYIYHEICNINIKQAKKDILIVSDAIHICGVTRKYNEICSRLEKDYDIIKLDSNTFHNYSMPLWNEIRFCIPNIYKYFYIKQLFKHNKPDKVHILTEGPLGFLTMLYCVNNNIKFTSMFCTRVDIYFEENISKYVGCIVRWYFKQFHKNSSKIITPGPSMIPIIKAITGNMNVISILNGCDLSAFTDKGGKSNEIKNLKKPIWLYVGRLCKSKGINEICKISNNLPGTVVVVGGGNNLMELQYNNPSITFLGWKKGNNLYSIYRSCDYFVFPSKTDTFGQVMVEAMASGLPVAAYPVTGPSDVVHHGVTGVLDDDLYKACMGLMKIPYGKEKCLEYSKKFSWDKMYKIFIKNV